MRVRTFGIITFTAMLFAATAAYAADIAIIVNKNNSNDIDRHLVEKIYNGEQSAWPGGGTIIIYDLQENSDIRAAFTQQLLGKTVSVMKAVWSMKLFSGRATPPKVMNSEGDMRNAVANNKNAIGYIQAGNADGSVKTVLTLR